MLWAQDAWQKAATLWRNYGVANGLYYEATELARLEEQAKLYEEKYQASGIGRDITAEPVDPAIKDSFRAYRKLYFHRQDLQMTNFAHHYYRAYAEVDPITIQARKYFFEANRFRLAQEPDRAMDAYSTAFEQWKKVLARYKEFREDTSIQEDMYEIQIQYTDLIAKFRGPRLRPLFVAEGLLAQTAATLTGAPPFVVLTGAIHGLTPGTKPVPIPVVGPLDQLDPDGRAWIEPSIARGLRVRLGKEEDPPAPPTAPTPEENIPRPRRPGGKP